VLRSDTMPAAVNAPITSANPSTSHAPIGRPLVRAGATGGFVVVIRCKVNCLSAPPMDRMGAILRPGSANL
jgi:hypothetical protein